MSNISSVENIESVAKCTRTRDYSPRKNEICGNPLTFSTYSCEDCINNDVETRGVHNSYGSYESDHEDQKTPKNSDVSDDEFDEVPVLLNDMDLNVHTFIDRPSRMVSSQIMEKIESKAVAMNGTLPSVSSLPTVSSLLFAPNVPSLPTVSSLLFAPNVPSLSRNNNNDSDSESESEEENEQEEILPYDHLAGRCKYQFIRGERKGGYCNLHVVAGSDFCASCNKKKMISVLTIPGNAHGLISTSTNERSNKVLTSGNKPMERTPTEPPMRSRIPSVTPDTTRYPIISVVVFDESKHLYRMLTTNFIIDSRDQNKGILYVIGVLYDGMIVPLNDEQKEEVKSFEMLGLVVGENQS